MKWFRSNYGARIDEFEVIKVTEHQVVYLDTNGRKCREARFSWWHSWHSTMEDAVKYVVKKEQDKIDGNLRQIEIHQENIKKIQSYLNDRQR